MTDKIVKRFTDSLPVPLHSRAQECAKKMGISVNDLIKKLLTDFFESGEKTITEVIENFEKRLDENFKFQQYLLHRLEELEKKVEKK